MKEQLERLKELLSYKVDLPHAVEGEAEPFTVPGKGKEGKLALEGRRTINEQEADRLFLEAVEEFVSILETHGMEELRAREKDAREEYANCTREEEEARERIKEIVCQEDYSEEKARFMIGAASVGLPFASPQDPVQVELARQAGIIRHRQRSKAEIAHRLSVLLNVRRLYQRRGAKGLEELRQLLAGSDASEDTPASEDQQSPGHGRRKEYNEDALEKAVWAVLKDRPNQCWHSSGPFKGQPNRSGIFKAISQSKEHRSCLEKVRGPEKGTMISDRTADTAIERILEANPERVKELRRKLEEKSRAD